MRGFGDFDVLKTFDSCAVYKFGHTYKRSVSSGYDGRVNSKTYKNGPVGCKMRVFSPPQLLFMTFLLAINI